MIDVSVYGLPTTMLDANRANKMLAPELTKLAAPIFVVQAPSVKKSQTHNGAGRPSPGDHLRGKTDRVASVLAHPTATNVGDDRRWAQAIQ